MSALDDLANEIHHHLSSFGLVRPRTAWLDAAVDEDELSWSLDDANVNLGEGLVEIDDELVYTRKFNSTEKTLTVAPDGRGWDGTTPAAHAKGARITIEPAFPRTSIKRAVNVAIDRCWPTLFGVDVHEFPFNASELTYELPAEAVSVLGITHETWGSSGVWLDVNAYSFDGDANTAAYPSGKAVTIGGSVPVGRTVRVLYSKKPTALTALSTQFSDSGLAESAKYAIILGASAHLLRFNDPARLSYTSAASDEFDTKKPYLTGVKLANDFEGQFQAELVKELGRLRQTYPARVVRKVL